ncbi:MAG: hypothetical protein IK017_05410 [Paludibacteraceae bacterium]|nr:hypothetical protein [Paludibacteraceae bacterium]
MRNRNICFIVLFSLMLVTPAIVSFFRGDDEVVNIENRKSVEKPVFATDTIQDATFMQKVICHVNDLKSYCTDYNKYYVDHFVFRNPMTKLYLAAKMRSGEGSLSETVISGKDGWYFLGEFYSNIVSESMGYRPFSSTDIDVIKQNILQCKSFCDELNIPIVFVVAPNKMTIYYEYFPYQAERKKSRYDQINEIMPELNVDYIDLKSLLLCNKQEDKFLYRKIDTHWSFNGSYLAYKAIMGKFCSYCPQMSFRHDSMYVKAYDMLSGDLSTMMAMPEMREPVEVYYPKCKPEYDEASQVACGRFQYIKRRGTYDAKGKILIFGDSFGCALFYFLASSCHETLFYQAIGGSHFDKDAVLREKPDCILMEVCERELEALCSVFGEHQYCE